MTPGSHQIDSGGGVVGGQLPTVATGPVYSQQEVSSALRRAAYFPLFSVPDPSVPSVPLPSARTANALIGMKVYEKMHRFDVGVSHSGLRAGFRACNRVGEEVASISIDWRVIPDDYVANPGVLPPPTELDPSRSQRFAMYDGHFKLNDTQKSGFHGFGAGRTFPVMDDGKPQLRIGAVVEILDGFGQLKGLQGNAVVNGFITPPNGLALNILLRLVDPEERLKIHSALPALQPIPEPDPGATFMIFLGEADPDHPITLNMTPQGRLLGATVHELLRLCHAGIDVRRGRRMGTRIGQGEIVGSLRFNLQLDSEDPRVPTPFQTTDALFTFFDRRRNTIGTLGADIVEGRAFRTELEGAPQPVVRVVGFGPFQKGTGQFCGASGMLSVNGCISIPARTPSILYVLRIADTDGAFRDGRA